MMMRLWHFSPGINVDWCQFRLWDGNVWVSQHLSGPWLSPDNGCFDTPWFVQKQQNTEEDQKKPQTSILDWGLSGKTWNNDVFLTKRITFFFNYFNALLMLNYSGGQAVLFVWNGVWWVSNSGSEEPRPLHLRHEVSSSGVADQPSLFSSGPVSGYFAFLTVLNQLKQLTTKSSSCLFYSPFSTRLSPFSFLYSGSMEDLTDPEKLRTDPKNDRTVSLYGYLRGTHMKTQGQVHIPGTSAPLKIQYHIWRCL